MIERVKFAAARQSLSDALRATERDHGTAPTTTHPRLAEAQQAAREALRGPLPTFEPDPARRASHDPPCGGICCYGPEERAEHAAQAYLGRLQQLDRDLYHHAQAARPAKPASWSTGR